MSCRIRGAIVGLVTAMFALAVAELLAGVIDDQASPIVAVGGSAIDATPEWLKDFAIRTFGQNDKTALVVGIVVVLTIVAIVVGIASLRRPWVGYVGLGVLGLVGAVAAMSRPDAGQLAMVPSVAGVGAGALVLARLLAAAGADEHRPRTLPVETPGDFDRRRFLFTSATFGAAAVVVGVAGRTLGAKRFGVAEASRDTLTIPAPEGPAPPRPPGVSLDVPGISPFITPNDDFYRVDTALIVPRVDATAWRLRIHGMVDRELELSLDDLLSRPLVERDLTLTCVSNQVGGGYAGNARWIGAPLKPILEEAGVHPGADQLVSRSADGFTAGSPTSVVLDGRDAILAVAMNGEPLPFAHGFPVRMIVPGLYGYVSATKWLTELELSTFEAFDPYWVERGWAPNGPVKTESRIDTPRERATLPAGPVTVAGVAWAQHRGIDLVEVRIDGGAWQPARLADVDTTDTWRQWSFAWSANPGRHTVEVRATDGEGITQTGERVPPFPDGATGWHSVAVTVA